MVLATTTDLAFFLHLNKDRHVKISCFENVVLATFWVFSEKCDPEVYKGFCVKTRRSLQKPCGTPPWNRFLQEST